AALLPGGALAQLEYCFVEVNLTVMAINLLPFAPLDGALAWRLFGELSASGWTLRRDSSARGWRGSRRHEGRGGAAGEESAAPPSSGAALSSGLAVPAPGAPLEPPASPAPPYARARSTDGPRSQRYGRAASGGAHHVDEEAIAAPRPSEQAQREI